MRRDRTTKGGNIRRQRMEIWTGAAFIRVASIAAHFETFKNEEHPRKYPG
jgi:hypothetical protein